MGSEWRSMPFGKAVLINPTIRLERGTTYPFVDMAAITTEYRYAYQVE